MGRIGHTEEAGLCIFVYPAVSHCIRLPSVWRSFFRETNTKAFTFAYKKCASTALDFSVNSLQIEPASECLKIVL